MGLVMEESLAEFNQSSVMNTPRAMKYQGVFIRWLSHFIDNVILFGVGLSVRDNVIGIQLASSWTLTGLFFLIYLGYYTYFEGTRGQTVGKMVTKIKVVREDGGEIDIKAAFVRNILRIIDGLFIYLVGAIFIWRSSKKQRLGDRMAKTVVIKA